MMIIKANSTYMPLQDKSVQAIITSPPYWGLRKYDISDTKFRDGWNGQLGNEPTIKKYINHLMDFMQECWRVLKDNGICFVNLGDTYLGGGMQGNDATKKGSYCKSGGEYPIVSKSTKNGKTKSLCLVPERFAISCLDAGWIIRNKII